MASDRPIEDQLRASLADRYRMMHEIGRGGMATVYLAEDLKHRRQVAVKVLNPELAESIGAERFLREIETAANLSHPHILPLFDSGEAGGLLFYVMPYVKGESLRVRLSKEKQLPVEDAVQITREIADALAYAHEQGVIHRDVKPANIMLEAGHAVLADFGVAHAVAEAKDQRLTRTGTSLGTPAYMSPEQATGTEELDGRSDQYALGCVLFEMLAGHPPFTGAQVEAVVRQHIAEEPPAVTRFRPTVTGEIVAVINRALAKNPPDRFRTTGEMAAALALTTAPVPASSRRRWGRTKALAYGGTVALGLATIWFVASSLPGGGPDLSDSLVAVLPFQNRTEEPALDQLGSMAADRISDALVGSPYLPFEIVPSQQVRSLLSTSAEGSAPSDAMDPMQAVSEATGAGMVVSGWYYRDGDSLDIQVEIRLFAFGSSVESVRVRVPAADRTAALEELGDRVLGTLGVAYWEASGRVVAGRFRPPPRHSAIGPSVEAERAFANRDMATAIADYGQAVNLDPDFHWARLRVTVAFLNLGRFAEADSVLAIVEQNSANLSGLNRLWLELRRAQLTGNALERLEASRAILRAEPGDNQNLYNVGYFSLTANRPREAIEALEPVRGRNYWYDYWDVLASSYHALGDHEGELAAAREGRGRYPNVLDALKDEVEALAAMGRREEVDKLLEESLSFSDGSPGEVMRIAALEFRVHGYPEESAGALERALAWYGNRPQRERETERYRFGLAETLAVAARWSEAEALAEELVQEFPDNLDYQGFLGTLAARLGKVDEAIRIRQELGELDDTYLQGVNHFWRGRISAVLGEEERAVDLLREAHSRGYEFWIDWHRMIDFESLRGVPAFEEFMRPKG